MLLVSFSLLAIKGSPAHSRRMTDRFSPGPASDYQFSIPSTGGITDLACLGSVLPVAHYQWSWEDIYTNNVHIVSYFAISISITYGTIWLCMAGLRSLAISSLLSHLSDDTGEYAFLLESWRIWLMRLTKVFDHLCTLDKEVRDLRQNCP